MGGQPYYIVLVEDNEADAFLVREAFRHHHLEFSLEVLPDGEKALELVERLEAEETQPCPDFYLLDLNLPKVSGDAVLDRIRNSRRCGQVPVMILTSSSFPSDQAEMMRLGATRYFQKPSRLSDFMQLGAIVKKLLARPNGAAGEDGV